MGTKYRSRLDGMERRIIYRFKCSNAGRQGQIAHKTDTQNPFPRFLIEGPRPQPRSLPLRHLIRLAPRIIVTLVHCSLSQPAAAIIN